MNEKDELLKDALIRFTEAYEQLKNVLDELECSKYHKGVDSIAGYHYPFDKSFDELDIRSWAERSIETLESKND